MEEKEDGGLSRPTKPRHRFRDRILRSVYLRPFLETINKDETCFDYGILSVNGSSLSSRDTVSGRCSMVAAPAKKKKSVIAAAVAAAAATGASSLSVPSAMVRRGSAPDMIQTELASINEQISGTALLVCVRNRLPILMGNQAEPCSSRFARSIFICQNADLTNGRGRHCT